MIHMNIKDVIRHLGLSSSVLGLYNFKINQKCKFVHTKKLTVLCFFDIDKTKSRRDQFKSTCYVTDYGCPMKPFFNNIKFFWHIRHICWLDFGVIPEELSCFFYKKKYYFSDLIQIYPKYDISCKDGKQPSCVSCAM